jgi:hypothetical protein
VQKGALREVWTPALSVEVVNNNTVTVTRDECLTDVDCTSRLRVGIQ